MTACPHCGRKPAAPLARIIAAPYFVFMALARLVIAIGAALSLLAILALLSRWGTRGFVDGWALFSLFVLSVGVLLLFEIRDFLRRNQAAAQIEVARSATPGVVAPYDDFRGAVWRSIGTLGSLVWLPFQSGQDRRLIDHLTFGEQRELQNRLALVTVCMAATTIAPVLVALAFLSPVGVCIAATVVASNLFVHDWFKKRHKTWLYSTTYAREHDIRPRGE